MKQAEFVTATTSARSGKRSADSTASSRIWRRPRIDARPAPARARKGVHSTDAPVIGLGGIERRKDVQGVHTLAEGTS